MLEILAIYVYFSGGHFDSKLRGMENDGWEGVDMTRYCDEKNDDMNIIGFLLK